MIQTDAPRRRARLRLAAHTIAALSVTLLVTSNVAVYLGESHRPDGGAGAFLVQTLQSGSPAFVLGFGGVGWLLARRVPDNPIGWCFSLGGLMWAVGALNSAWFELALAGRVELDALARACATANVFFWIFSMPFSVQLPLLLLPDGRPLSARWRYVVWLVLAGVAVGTVGFSTIPGVIEGTDPALHLVNPLGVRVLGPLPQALALTGAGMLLVGLAAGVVALGLRFRRARGVQRQQMRWVALGGCLVLLGPLTALVPGDHPVLGVLATLGILAVPTCVGVAVLRYRLYDLGRILSRTVAYLCVTALLLGAYFVVVTTSARLLPDGSSLAVAASTLVTAALFQPLRRRVQRGVDHRFNRARYDAERTLEAFRRRLRDEVDLDAVRSDLLRVVDGAVQPVVVGLWLRDSAR